jgi:hypothetical protein
LFVPERVTVMNRNEKSAEAVVCAWQHGCGGLKSH